MYFLLPNLMVTGDISFQSTNSMLNPCVSKAADVLVLGISGDPFAISYLTSSLGSNWLHFFASS